MLTIGCFGDAAAASLTMVLYDNVSKNLVDVLLSIKGGSLQLIVCMYSRYECFVATVGKCLERNMLFEQGTVQDLPHTIHLVSCLQPSWQAGSLLLSA